MRSAQYAIAAKLIAELTVENRLVTFSQRVAEPFVIVVVEREKAEGQLRSPRATSRQEFDQPANWTVGRLNRNFRQRPAVYSGTQNRTASGYGNALQAAFDDFVGNSEAGRFWVGK